MDDIEEGEKPSGKYLASKFRESVAKKSEINKKAADKVHAMMLL